ncbi:hypothetical protein SAMN05421493_11718 [Pseudobutyrivibrio sp. 49]|uniref:hypothetical protein n=1 Tax=Pseudobutyrivibrio sp. 49 TaxID=1855344 RepID=UPI000889C689|nr:hypothetical protein [Pseudobutyrivibrio sp. 49]SDI52213.1 hypothetical protein SAMN05421493_11718 [Pseudobutyrivibrio sp. 49]
MAAIYDVNRQSLWVHSNSGQGKLNYTIKNDKAVFCNSNVDTNGYDSLDATSRISYYDIQDIDVRACSFDDFCKVMQFAKDSYSSFLYDSDLLLSFKEDFSDSKMNDFYQFFEEYRLECAHNGDMKLYHKIVPIVQACYNMIQITDHEISSELTEDGYFKTNIFNDECCLGCYDSYYLGDEIFDFGGTCYRVTAQYDIESSDKNPVIDVYLTDFISGEKLKGTYIVDINSIDLKCATPLEVFAYLSYKESIDDANWESTNNIDSNFKLLFDSGALNVDSLSDFTDKTLNLYTAIKDTTKKLTNSQPYLNKNIDFEIYKKNLTKEYIEKCLKLCENILMAIDSDES